MTPFHLRRASVALAAACFFLGTGSPPGPALGPVHLGAQEAYAFVGVHVVPMDRYGVLEDRTVVVRGGTIEAVEASEGFEVPADATVIPGEGRFLLPGLAEMHARIPGSETPEEVVEDLLFLYLAHGITTVRSMAGARGHRDLKLRALRNQILSPILYLASPPIAGEEEQEPDTVEALVEGLARQNWDFLRVDEDLTREVWDRLTETAIGRGLTYGGVVSDSVGLRYALATGISSVEHLDGFLEESVNPETKRRLRSDPDLPMERLLEATDLQEILAIAGRTRSAGTYVAPTLQLLEIRARPTDLQALDSLPDLDYVPPEIRLRWREEKRGAGAEPRETAERLVEVRGEIVEALNDVGAELLMAAGSLHAYSAPGFSLHRELRALRDAGLTPYEILLTGTRNVAQYASRELGEAGNFGAVAPGNRADLILVDENPLEGLETLERPAGVMARGRWIPASRIEARLEEIRRKYGR